MRVFPQPHDVVKFQRFYEADDESMDRDGWPMGRGGCLALASIWVKSLHTGRYRKIILTLANGQTVIVRARKPKLQDMDASAPGYTPALSLWSGGVEIMRLPAFPAREMEGDAP